MVEFESRLAFEYVDKLVYEIGPRLAGTSADAMAADYIREQFKSFGLKVKSHEFKFVNRSTRSKVTSFLLGIAFAASLLLAPMLSLLVWLAAIVLWRSLKRLMPKYQSQNVIATKKVEAPKKIIAVTAHYDSAQCWVSYKLLVFLKLTFLPLIALILAVLVLRVLGLVPVWPIVWVLLAAVFIPICVVMFVSTSGRLVSPGAEDNASGTAVMLELARVIGEESPEDTEVSFIAFGAEEQGLVGASKLAKDKLLASETLVLNLDMVGAGSQAYIIEGNGILRRRRTSSRINKALKASIQRVGLSPKFWWVAFAGHDHIPLVKAGLQATTFSFDIPSVDELDCRIAKLFKIPNARTRGYTHIHAIEDTPEHIKLETIEKAGAIALDFIKTT